VGKAELEGSQGVAQASCYSFLREGLFTPAEITAGGKSTTAKIASQKVQGK
tara:strand:- start:329 stop:481 length:153 start_codon:yes stop_codon:yes gene_type:complete